MKKTMMLLMVAVLLTGCATQRDWYKEQAWTPDGFNYTLQRERDGGALSDYWGLSWSFK